MDKKYVLSAAAGGERTTSAHWPVLPCRSGRGGAARLRVYGAVSGIKGYADMDKANSYSYDGYTVALLYETHYPAGVLKGLNAMSGKADDTHRHGRSANSWNWHNARETHLMVGACILIRRTVIKEGDDSGRLGDFYLSNRRPKCSAEKKRVSLVRAHEHSYKLLTAHAVESKKERSSRRVYDGTLVQLEYPATCMPTVYS